MTNNNNKENTDKKSEKEEEEERKKNKKVFIVVGVAIGVVIIIIILILLLFTFCRRGLPETAGTTETTEIVQESEEEQATEASGEITTVTEEIEETTGATTAPEETTETTGETTEETTSETSAIAPTINLVIQLGPVYSSADNVCYWRVKANVTGTPTPRIVWSRDDSGGAWGRDIAQVNLHSPTETYTLTATATNSAGSATASITLRWGCNRPPEIQWIDPLEGFITGLTYAINAYATDPDGDALTYQWNLSCGSFTVTNPSRIEWTTPSSPCTCEITVTVNDGRGGTDTQTETVVVTAPNRPPVLGEIVITEQKTGYIPSIIYAGENYNLSVSASDPDGDTLNYSWSVTGGTISNPAINPTVWHTPEIVGYYTITVNVNDGRGGTASKSKTVHVQILY